jgi:hypothetical protein
MNFNESDNSLSANNNAVMAQQSEKNIDKKEELSDRILSRMNSMECWDYSVELECLNGPPGYKLYHIISAIS